jgi:hypothetical protein
MVVVFSGLQHGSFPDGMSISRKHHYKLKCGRHHLDNRP